MQNPQSIIELLQENPYLIVVLILIAIIPIITLIIFSRRKDNKK